MKSSCERFRFHFYFLLSGWLLQKKANSTEFVQTPCALKMKPISDPPEQTKIIFVSKSLIDKNLKPPVFKCNACTRVFKGPENLRRHRNYECGVPKKYFCPFCEKRFAYRFRVKSHVSNVHPPEGL